MDSLYIVMPAYNEEANIEATVRAWYPLIEDKAEKSRLIVTDSESTDGTHDILTRLQQEFPKLVILSDTLKQHGPKLIALYKYAISNGIDYVFQTDSDGQTNPDEFDAFWQDRDKYDGQFGNRTVRGDGQSRAFVEKVVCILLRMYFGVSIPDANAPFRLMKVSAVERYIERFHEDYNLPNIMITTFFVHYGEHVLFREISFSPRTAGKNSINISKIVKIGIQALRDFRIYKKDMTSCH